MFQLKLETETCYNPRANSFEYTCINANRVETLQYTELVALQDRIERYLWTHPQYIDHVRGVNEMVGGGLAEAEKSGDYYHHKKRQLRALLRQFRRMSVSFNF